jgi:hypothetical protein
MSGIAGFKVVASLLILSLVASSPLLQLYTQLTSPEYVNVNEGKCCSSPSSLTNVTILNFVNVTSLKPLEFNVVPVNLSLKSLLLNSSCLNLSSSNLKFELSFNILLNETRGKFGTLFLEVTAKAYNETHTLEGRAYILAHKANITHEVIEVLAVLKPTSVGEGYELVSIIADYKPLEDAPTRLADIVYLNTTTLNTDMKLSQAIRTIATITDRMANTYEKGENDTLKLQAKAYKSIATQLRIVSSYFESKLKDYNKQVVAVAILLVDQEEELFINWCQICIVVASVMCSLVAAFGSSVEVCISLCTTIFPFPFNLVCAIVCLFVVAGFCVMGACDLCEAIGLCPGEVCPPD